MKNFLIILTVLYLMTVISCTNNKISQEQKHAKDVSLIHQFFKFNNTQNVIQASKMFLNKASFNCFTGYETKLEDSYIKEYLFTFEESYEEDLYYEEESYYDMLLNLYNFLDLKDEDIMYIIIDSIQIDSSCYRVYQNIKSPVFKEFGIPFPSKIEDFYIEQDTITKIVLQSVNIPDVTRKFNKEMSWWIYKFTDYEIKDYHSLLQEIAGDEMKKSVIENYKEFKSFEDSLMNKYKYQTRSSLRDLHKEAFLTNKLEDVPIKLYLSFERIELYFDPVLQSEDDTTQLVHLYFSDKQGTGISGVTRVQDSTAFAHLKPKQMCAIYGLGTKNLVGELQLKDVVVYSYPQNK